MEEKTVKRIRSDRPPIFTQTLIGQHERGSGFALTFALSFVREKCIMFSLDFKSFSWRESFHLSPFISRVVDTGEMSV